MSISAPPIPTSVVAQPTSTHGGGGGSRSGPRISAPNPLAPLSPGQIRSAALSTVGAAYGPAFTELSNQSNDIKNLDAKRSADSQAYSTWLATQGAALVQNNAQIMDHLETANATAQATASAGINSAVGASGAVPGSALSTLLGATAAAAQNRLGTSVELGNTRAGVSSSLTNAAVANSLAVQSNLRTSQSASADKALQSVSNARMKLTAGETSDVAKEIARLGGVEISKAQIRQNYAAAVAKLGLSAQQLASADAYRQGTLANNRTRNNITAANDAARNQLGQQNFASTQHYRQWQESIGNQKLSDAEQKDLYQRLNHLGPYKPGATHGGGLTMTPTQSRATFDTIDKLNGQINAVATQAHVSKQEAYHLILNGASYNMNTGRKDAHGNPIIKTMKATQAPSAELLNAAYNLNTLGRINPSDLAALNRLGLYGVRQKYQVSDSTPAGYTNTAGNRRT